MRQVIVFSFVFICFLLQLFQGQGARYSNRGARQVTLHDVMSQRFMRKCAHRTSVRILEQLAAADLLRRLAAKRILVDCGSALEPQ